MTLRSRLSKAIGCATKLKNGSRRPAMSLRRFSARTKIYSAPRCAGRARRSRRLAAPPRRALARRVVRTAPFLDGLELDLGPTPAPLGASSYARALARFGAAYARAAISTGRPFVLASDPSDVHPMRRGALFGSLLVDAVFLRRKLGLSRDAASRAARSVAATVLASVRLDAVRTLVDFATTSASAIEEAASDALNVHVPASLAGLLPRPDGRAPSRLLGVLLATVIARPCAAASTKIGSTTPARSDSSAKKTPRFARHASRAKRSRDPPRASPACWRSY